MSQRKQLVLMVLILAGQFITLLGQHHYDARLARKEILTPAPAKSQNINGPEVYGARPGMKFIYRIPFQGERPVRYRVNGLPDGLKLDAERGILTGTVPVKKVEYVMTFKAKNTHGEDLCPYKLVVGDKLALTTPTG